jgi:hypothetical protein
MGHEGDLIVVCVDHANDVWKELQRRQHGGSAPSGSSDSVDQAVDDLVAIEVDG